MRKIFFLIFLLACGFLQSAASSLLWTSNFQKAQKESIRQNKPLFVFFTGSDWCSECLYFENNILKNNDFIDELKDLFLFVYIDFPLNRPLNAKQSLINKKLKERFNIVGLPTIAIILPSDNAILMAAPSSISPKKLAKALIAETDATLALEYTMNSFKPQDLSNEQLISLYQAARLISHHNWREQLLDAGLKKTSISSFFLREKYRLLLQKGEKNNMEAQKIRLALLESDPDNELGHQLYMAVSDFESNIDTKQKNAAAPLVDFLHRFRKPEGSWRVKAMLGSYFLAAKDFSRAREYLLEAIKDAPQEKQEALRLLVNKIPCT